MSDTALILGASGRFGSHAAEAFWNAGWRVRIFDRANATIFLSAAAKAPTSSSMPGTRPMTVGKRRCRF